MLHSLQGASSTDKIHTQNSHGILNTRTEKYTVSSNLHEKNFFWSFTNGQYSHLFHQQFMYSINDKFNLKLHSAAI